jgi:NTE family protein
MHALTLLIEQRLIVEIAYFAERADIVVLPPLCPLSVSAVDFGATNELLSKSHRSTGDWLDADNHHLPHPERFLSLHGHQWAREALRPAP